MDFSFSDVNSSISINPQNPPEATKYQVPIMGPVVPDVSLVFGTGSVQMENLYQPTSTQHADIFNSSTRATQFGTHIISGSKFENGKISKSSSSGRHIASSVSNETELANIKDWYISNKYGLHLNQGFDKYLRDTENSSSQTVPKSVEFSDSLVYKWGSKDAAEPSKTENVQQKRDSKLKAKMDFTRDFQVPVNKEIIESEIDEICKFSRTLEELCKESEILKSGSKINKQVIESEIDQICKVSDTLQKLYEESEILIPETTIKAVQNFSRHSENLNDSHPKSTSPKEHFTDSWKGNEPIPVPRAVKPIFIETKAINESKNENCQFNGAEYNRNDEFSHETLDKLGRHSKIGDPDYLRYSKTMTLNTQSMPKSVYSVNKYSVTHKPSCIMDTHSNTKNGKLSHENDSYTDNTKHCVKDTCERDLSRNYNLSDTIEELCKETEILNAGSKESRVINYSQTVDLSARPLPVSAEFKERAILTNSQNFLLKPEKEALKPENNIVTDIYGIDHLENGAKISKALERLCEESEKQTNLLKTITESLQLFNTQQDLLFSNLFKKLDCVLDVANHRKLCTPEKVDAETLTSPYIENNQKIIGVDEAYEKRCSDKIDPSSEKILAPVEYVSSNQVPKAINLMSNSKTSPDTDIDHRQFKTEESQFLGTESIHLSEINVPTPAFNQPTPVSSIHVDIQDYEEFTDDDDRIDSHSNGYQNANSSLISCDGRQEIFYRKVVGQVSKLLKGSSSFKRDSTYRCTEVKKSEKMTLSGKEVVKRATIRQQQLLGINVQERSVIEETILVPAEHNSVGNKFGSRLDELAGKYLKTQEQSQIMPNHTNISMATRQYLERYQILPSMDCEY